jgi:hypothetical protein
MPLVEHAIDRGDTDARVRREVGDGRSPGPRLLLRDSIIHRAQLMMHLIDTILTGLQEMST